MNIPHTINKPRKKASQTKADSYQSNIDKDKAIGQRLKSLRLILGFTQASLSKIMNITFQQVQKYEKGINRISASTLWKLSESLGVDLNYFFTKESESDEPLVLNAKKVSIKSSNNNQSSFYDKEACNVIKHFKSIESPVIRKKILMLIQSIAQGENGSNAK